MSARDEARLERANNSVQVRPNAANNNFGNHFIRNIAKANRVKLINGLGPINLGNKGYIGTIKFNGDGLVTKKILDERAKRWVYTIPVFVIVSDKTQLENHSGPGTL